MFFVWQKGISQPTAYKCDEIPTNGDDKPAPYIVKHVLREEEECMLIRDLERIYPAPEYASTE